MLSRACSTSCPCAFMVIAMAEPTISMLRLAQGNSF
jgi:hypothetical protein